MRDINSLKKIYLDDLGISEGTIAWRAFLDSDGLIWTSHQKYTYRLSTGDTGRGLSSR